MIDEVSRVNMKHLFEINSLNSLQYSCRTKLTSSLRGDSVRPSLALGSRSAAGLPQAGRADGQRGRHRLRRSEPSRAPQLLHLPLQSPVLLAQPLTVLLEGLQLRLCLLQLVPAPTRAEIHGNSEQQEEEEEEEEEEATEEESSLLPRFPVLEPDLHLPLLYV